MNRPRRDDDDLNRANGFNTIVIDFKWARAVGDGAGSRLLWNTQRYQRDKRASAAGAAAAPSNSSEIYAVIFGRLYCYVGCKSCFLGSKNPIIIYYYCCILQEEF